MTKGEDLQLHPEGSLIVYLPGWIQNDQVLTGLSHYQFKRIDCDTHINMKGRKDKNTRQKMIGELILLYGRGNRNHVPSKR